MELSADGSEDPSPESELVLLKELVSVVRIPEYCVVSTVEVSVDAVPLELPLVPVPAD